MVALLALPSVGNAQRSDGEIIINSVRLSTNHFQARDLRMACSAVIEGQTIDFTVNVDGPLGDVRQPAVEIQTNSQISIAITRNEGFGVSYDERLSEDARRYQITSSPILRFGERNYYAFVSWTYQGDSARPQEFSAGSRFLAGAIQLYRLKRQSGYRWRDVETRSGPISARHCTPAPIQSEEAP
jgi:hypothetical protein